MGIEKERRPGQQDAAEVRTYEAVFPLEVSVFELPDRFMVECRKPDDEYRKFFPGMEDFSPMAPYLVDLGDGEFGMCMCRWHNVFVAPFLGKPGEYPRTCPHIDAALVYKQQLETNQLKQLPCRINL